MDFEILVSDEQNGRENFTVRYADGSTDQVDYYDYEKVYAIPGLAIELRRKYFHSYSDWILCSAFTRVLAAEGVPPEDVRILDFGAGSGCFGEEARREGFGAVVGVDIVPEARTEALRQHPHTYDDYLVLDIRCAEQRAKLIEWNLNALVAINALGNEHVSSDIFSKALSCIRKPGWVVFNMMAESNATINEDEHAWFRDHFDIVDRFRFFNRTSIDGRIRYFNEGLVCRW